MKVLWQGQYLDGKTSTPRRVDIRPLKSGLRITLDNGEEVVWAYPEIHQVQGSYTGEPVRLEKGDGLTEVLTIPDTDFLHTLRAKSLGQSSRFHDPGFRSARRWLTFYAALATLAVSFAVYRWGIPALAKNVASRVPISWEEGVGKSELEQLAPPETRVKDPRLAQAIQKIMDKLTSTVPQCPYHFHVVVSNLPIVNAFALPGGSIVVFNGLLEETRAPEELAGVLAHEIQHVLKRHTTQRIIQDSSTGLLIAALSGDFTGSMAFGMKSARTLALLEYSRDEEEEADIEGMKMVLAAGIDPRGMIRFFEVLKKQEKMPKFMKYVSTHPATGDRIKKLQDIVDARGLAGGKPVNEVVAGLSRPPSSKEKLVPEVDWPVLVKGLKSSR